MFIEHDSEDSNDDNANKDNDVGGNNVQGKGKKDIAKTPSEGLRGRQMGNQSQKARQAGEIITESGRPANGEPEPQVLEERRGLRTPRSDPERRGGPQVIIVL